MADYHIYLHGSGNLEEKKPTQPKSENEEKKPTQPSDNSSGGVSHAFNKTISVVSNPDGLISAGVNSVAKAVPYIAAAYAVTHLADKVVSTVMEFQTAETGDYSGQMVYNNAKVILGNMFRPFNTALQYAKTMQSARIQQYKIDENMKLIGDSIINNGNKGV